jgi:hypothetical protein
MALLTGVVALILGATPCQAAELDDSGLFVEAFNAFQKKDFLLTIDKIGQLSEIFPDSPLRDISLLLLARAGLKSGDNELAAKSVQRFSAEFPDNALNSALEDELLSLATRRNKGEKLPPNKQLQAIALKTSQERVAREKAEKEQKERERLAAEKAAREAIKLAIAMPVDNQQIEVGKEGLFTFELNNKGTKREEFLLSAQNAKEVGVLISSADKAEEPIDRVVLSPGESFKGAIKLRMPSERVDGFKAPFQLKVVSAAFSDVTFSKAALATASAPLVRAVARPLKAKIIRGEQVKYRVTVLNAGSLTARKLTVRVTIPDQLDLIDLPGTYYSLEKPGTLVFNAPDLETGRLAEFEINVKAIGKLTNNQELRFPVEVINGHIQRTEHFTSSAITLQGS